MLGYCILWTHQCASGTDCKVFNKEKLQVHKYKGHKEPVSGSNFLELNLAAIHEQGEWHIHFQCILGLREGRDLLLVKSSPVKQHKCLRCHIVMDVT